MQSAPSESVAATSHVRTVPPVDETSFVVVVVVVAEVVVLLSDVVVDVMEVVVDVMEVVVVEVTVVEVNVVVVDVIEVVVLLSDVVVDVMEVVLDVIEVVVCVLVVPRKASSTARRSPNVRNLAFSASRICTFNIIVPFKTCACSNTPKLCEAQTVQWYMCAACKLRQNNIS